MHNYLVAENELKRSLTLDPKPADVLGDLVNAYYFSGDYGGALQALDLLEKRQPLTAVNWFFRAICCDKLKQTKEAAAAYQKFLDLDQGSHADQDFQARQRQKDMRAENSRGVRTVVRTIAAGLIAGSGNRAPVTTGRGATARHELRDSQVRPPALLGTSWALAMISALSRSGAHVPAVREQGSRSKYQAQYDAEGDPVRKAKILAKLGPFEMGEARVNLRADKDEQALAVA